jgi:hypothetical protein
VILKMLPKTTITFLFFLFYFFVCPFMTHYFLANKRPWDAVSVRVIKQSMDVLLTGKSNLNITISVTLLSYVIFQTILSAFVKSCMCT